MSTENVDTDGTCSADEVCNTQHRDSMAADLTLTPHKMMQTIAAVELYHAQREVANYLELAYLQLGDHPEVAREVRMTAHAARTQHMMSSGLMKKFTVTAAHIVNTMIPLILDAVELQDRDIIMEAFGQIIENAEAMKKESEETRTSYLTIQSQIQENLASVNTRNKHVVDESKRLKVEMERQKQMAKAADMAQKQLDDERKQMEEELQTLKSNRDRWMNAAEAAGKDMDSNSGSFLDDVLGPSTSMGGKAGIVLGIIKGAGNIFSSMFGANKKEKKYKELLNAYRESENSVLNVMKMKSDVTERRNNQRKDALERLSELKKLSFEQAGLGNAESLREASLHLGDVDKQLVRIILFWETMAATLKYLKEDVKSGEVYLKKIENPKYTERFKKSIGRADKDWKFFGRICSDYVQETDSEIRELYKFLSAPIDNQAGEERARRQKELWMSIEHDIYSAFPKEIKDAE